MHLFLFGFEEFKLDIGQSSGVGELIFNISTIVVFDGEHCDESIIVDFEYTVKLVFGRSWWRTVTFDHC
jgi:hypothetical protein